MILIERTSHKGSLLGYNIEDELVARECTSCKEFLSISDFGKNKSFVGGVDCQCKKCSSIVKKRNYERRKSSKSQKINKALNGDVLGRVCSKCNTYKDKQFFGVQNHKKNKTGVSSRCKQCMAVDRKIRTESGKARDAWLKTTYGITQDIYDIMLEKQQGVCSICKGTVPNNFTANKNLLVVDHCHTTGKVRSLLCSTCNVAVGRFETSYNEDSVKRFFSYLELCKSIKETADSE